MLFCTLVGLSLCSCRNATINMNHELISGKWVVRSFKTERSGIAGELFYDYLSDVRGATIYCYTQGVAEIVLRNGKSSVGYLFFKEPAGADVTFWFDEKVGDLDQLPIYGCALHSENTLVSDDGQDHIELVRESGSCPHELSSQLMLKIEKRRSITLTNLMDIESRKEKDYLDANKGEPGVQGREPSGAENMFHSDQKWLDMKRKEKEEHIKNGQ